MEFYIGKPYSFSNFNCWDYVAKIREENNIKTSRYRPKNIDEAFKIITAEMQKLGHGLIKVSTPQDFDIVIINKSGKTRPAYHCGIYYQNSVIHCDRIARQVIAQTYTEFTANCDGVNFWR